MSVPAAVAAGWDVGLATASDAAILAYGREQGLIVATLDADFHAQLAVSRAAGPSVIRIRIEGLRGKISQICLPRF